MGGKSSTTTQENKPPAWAKPLFEQSAKEAKTLYNRDKGFNVYGGDRVADMNVHQTDALRTLGGMDDYAAGMDYSKNRFQSLYNEAGGPSYAAQNLQGIAAGNSLMGDPMFQEMLDRESQKIGDQANMAFSAAGRYGSGAHTGALGDAVGDFRRDSILQNYSAERDRQMQANSMLDQQRLAGIGMQGDFANSIANAGQQRFSNMQTGAGAALQAGTFRQQQQQANLDAKKQAWTEKDMEAWTRLGALQAAATGSAGPYGMMQTTQNQPFNPLGLLGSLGSLFMPSDRRLKKDIVPAGEKNGFNLYEFSYLDSPTRFRGVMADEVATVRPDAIHVRDDGMMMVNYAALGLTMETVDV
jgi:hypothetical protein